MTYSFFRRLLSYLFALTLALCAFYASADYMPPDLRDRVEQLKIDRKSIPTTTLNAPARAMTLWEWINAFALAQRYVPVDATRFVAQSLAGTNTPFTMGQLDAAINELTFLDDNPQGIGQLVATTGPFPVADFATIAQTYTVGTTSIQTGGGFLVARHFMANFGLWQTTDPKADHYISIVSSNPRVTFVASSKPVTGMHGGFRTSRSTLMFEVASGTLVEGDTVTITYGDTSKGSRGILTPSFSSDRMPLPLYIAFTANGQFMSVPIQPVRTIGGAVAGVAAFAPSIVSPGETFEISIRAQDQYYNRATGEIPNWQLDLGSDEPTNIASSGAITVAEVTLDAPGVYHPRITSQDGVIKGSGNPILVSETPRSRVFWGDTHGHSGFAEGIGTPDRFMQWAKEDARLDFVTHSEHDVWLDDAEWEVLRNNVSAYTEEGKFVAYLGYEWTVYGPNGGHHNVLFRRPQGVSRVPAQFYPTLSKLYQGLRSSTNPKDVVVIPHAHQAGDYRQNDPELEPLVEIMSQHGNFEWFGRMYLEHGHEVGFTAASDNHLSQPGYSPPLGGSLSQRGGLGALLAQEATTDSLFDAMKNLQSYATTGDRIILDFAVNDTSMGKRAPFQEDRVINGRVIGTAPIDSITIIKNDKEIWQQNYLATDANRLGKSETFLLSFASDSEPFHRGDNPRGWRSWEGTLEVLNGTIESIEAYDASFPLQNLKVAEDNPNLVTFATKTRGDTSSYLLKLSNLTRNSRIQFDLVETPETGGAPPIYRRHQRIPAVSFVLALKDMQQGKVSFQQVLDGYTDKAQLRHIRTDGAKDITFTVNDSSSRQGDYYFVRVVQANDAIAWSSPVWIGGHAKR
ncbi:MAG: DUF3604 domain-containing protein [Pseudomonadota bacterium]